MLMIAPSMAAAIFARRRLRGEERAAQVHREHPIEFVRRELQERLPDRDAGVVNEHRGRAELGNGPSHPARDVSGFADVDALVERLAAVADHHFDGFRAGVLGWIGDRDGNSPCRQRRMRSRDQSLVPRPSLP
jgi:hypothetical protein